MTIKFVHSPGSAYEIAIGITAQEASDANLAVVEQSFATNPPTPVYGRYIDAPTGHALGVTVDAGNGTKVIGGGSVVAAPSLHINDKGSLLNINDPIAHGGTGDDTVHADNAEPLADNADEQTDLLKAGAHDPAVIRSGKDAKANTK